MGELGERSLGVMEWWRNGEWSMCITFGFTAELGRRKGRVDECKGFSELFAYPPKMGC